VTSACLALVCLSIGHASALESPAAGLVRDLLDGPLALLRNVHKIDPPLRLPLAIGVGVAFARAVQWSAVRSPRVRWIAPAVLAGLVLGLAQPALALNLRTPGWGEVPDYWQETAQFLEDQPGESRAWVVPGSGFGVQTWGWTMDEPMADVATTPWFTRSQVPLVPPQTIRVLSRLEGYLETGSGSPNLGTTLGRLGVGHVVVRHDLDPSLSEATASNLVSIALARSRGIERVAQLGALEYGPAVEIYAVVDDITDEFSLRPLSSVATVAGSSPDVIDAVGTGLIQPGQPAIVQGDDGWDSAADIVGDSYRERERDFGRVHDAESHVLAAEEPRRSKRKVSDYPANEGSRPLIARYDGISYVTASSSQAFVGSAGGLRPETAPFSAIDGDLVSAWQPSHYGEPRGEWIEIHYDAPRPLREFTLTSSVSDRLIDDVTAWRVTAGGETVTARVNPFTGRALGDLGGVRADTVRFTVTGTAARGGFTLGTVGLQEIEMAGLPATRTMVVPEADLVSEVDYLFTAQPETRACITTLLAPDCRFDRRRQSEESVGIDRTFTVPSTGEWRLRGTALARARPSTAQLLDPLGDRMLVRASSSLGSDPTVSGRMAYDGATTTSWIADPYDPSPTLTITLDRPRTVDRIDVVAPAPSAAVPTTAVVRAGGENRQVDLGGLGRFEAVRAKEFTVTFENPTRGLLPIGLSEIYLEPGGHSVPLYGEATTGSVCGYGPNIEVDGRRYLTRVEGMMGNVVSAGPLDIVPCGRDRTLRLAEGEHRVRILSTDQFQPVVVILDHEGAPQPTEEPSRSLSVVTNADTRQELVVGPGGSSILSTTRNANRGWVATLDGETLPVQRVEGWAQGWLVPAGAGGRVEITYAPERSYVIVLVAGLAITGLALVLALVLLVRTRLRRGYRLEPATPSEPWSLRRSVLLGAFALPVLWVLGGIPAVAGLALVGLISVARVPALALGGVLLVGAAGAAAAHAQWHESYLVTASDGLAGAGFVLCAIVAVLGGRRSGTP
jgi:arabinofuranan 3-O-arabinosyltransferase